MAAVMEAHSPPDFREIAMHSEASSIFTKAERFWRDAFFARQDDSDEQGDRVSAAEAAARRRRNWTEEDFLWCWQHRGFW
ncbi:hypothetical protein M8997_002540 [Phyllobacterium sp. 21LDTY02-6]|uniref:hypothetical protein n=2 Tax=Phyllobacterium TaxID=28100 RepID=UPI0020212086|nr:hypothetical protein [Phyllobacterium sp. 21LDTY02-6]MCO4316048.1 hypothetical protein [Phyllobacterium sp. 21LDTY02-6]